MKFKSILCLSLSSLAICACKVSDTKSGSKSAPKQMGIPAKAKEDSKEVVANEASPASIPDRSLVHHESREAIIERLKKKRDQYLVDFGDLRPKPGADASQQAVAAFSRTGLRVLDATIRIIQPGCVIEINQGEKLFRERLKDFPSCRFGEDGQQGKPEIRQVKGITGSTILIAHIKGDDGYRCVTKLKSLTLGNGSPRISKKTWTLATCNYRDFDSTEYELLPIETFVMQAK